MSANQNLGVFCFWFCLQGRLRDVGRVSARKMEHVVKEPMLMAGRLDMMLIPNLPLMKQLVLW